MSSFSIAILLLTVIPLINTEKTCPGYGYVQKSAYCRSSCSAENDRCAPGFKCCYLLQEPCGFHCITPKDDIVQKPGICPVSKPDALSWFICDVHDCDVDKDCYSIQKCCKNRCGSKICIVPESFV